LDVAILASPGMNRIGREEMTHHFGTANDTVFHARRGITASDVGFEARELYVE
jgi:hypothetical protein